MHYRYLLVISSENETYACTMKANLSYLSQLSQVAICGLMTFLQVVGIACLLLGWSECEALLRGVAISLHATWLSFPSFPCRPVCSDLQYLRLFLFFYFFVLEKIYRFLSKVL